MQRGDRELIFTLSFIFLPRSFYAQFKILNLNIDSLLALLVFSKISPYFSITDLLGIFFVVNIIALGCIILSNIELSIKPALIKILRISFKFISTINLLFFGTIIPYDLILINKNGNDVLKMVEGGSNRILSFTFLTLVEFISFIYVFNLFINLTFYPEKTSKRRTFLILSMVLTSLLIFLHIRITVICCFYKISFLIVMIMFYTGILPYFILRNYLETDDLIEFVSSLLYKIINIVIFISLKNIESYFSIVNVPEYLTNDLIYKYK